MKKPHDPSLGAGSARYFSIAEIAEMLGVATRTVRRWIDDHKLVAHRWPPRLLRVSEQDLRVFLAAHRA